MQVVCSTCQLGFDAPDGATGLVCPICRGPLLPKSADGSPPKSADVSEAKLAPEWHGGDLDDLIALLSGPALSARVEVLPASGDTPIGEVHLLAGGVSDAFFGGKSTDDALDRLHALKPTRFRIDQRLPNPVDGNLISPGPEAGTLDGRALAHLMRYCEDYVITCAIDVWRGNENARVEYKRGEISGVTVGGIDAPERLAEVMQWTSGNYRLVVPVIKLPAIAPKRVKPETPAPAPSPAASAQAARQASATKTMFGMPIAEIAKARAAAEAIKLASAEAVREAARESTKESTQSAPVPPAAQPKAPAPAQPAAPRSSTPVPVVAPPAARVTPPGVAPSQTPSPLAAQRSSATKTIFGVPAPNAPEGYLPGARPAEPGAPALAAEGDSARTETSKVDRKTGARKVEVPGPAVIPPPAGVAPSPAQVAAPVAAPSMEPSEPQPTTQPGFDTRSETRKRPEPVPGRTNEKQRKPPRETPIWTYVGVGFTFGLALLGIYQLYGLLAH
jgi:hypothetical protein